MFYVPSAMPMPAFVPAAPGYHPMASFNSMLHSSQPSPPHGAWVFCPTPAVFPAHIMQQQRLQGDRPDSSSNQRMLKNAKLFKTELCRSWMDFGRCNYGDRCQYAHGEDERRSLPRPRHPKYKTEPCVMFARYGSCAYGAGCHFVHDDSLLLRGSPPISFKSETVSAVSSNNSSPRRNNQSTSTFCWPSIDSLEQSDPQQQLLIRSGPLPPSSSLLSQKSVALPQTSSRLPVFQHITDSNDHHLR